MFSLYQEVVASKTRTPDVITSPAEAQGLKLDVPKLDGTVQQHFRMMGYEPSGSFYHVHTRAQT